MPPQASPDPVAPHRPGAGVADAPATAVPRAIGLELSGRGPSYLDNVVLENLLDAFLELAAEVWTLTDRQRRFERALAELGLDAASLVETRVPDAAEAAERKAARDAYVGRLFESFLRRPDGEVR